MTEIILTEEQKKERNQEKTKAFWTGLRKVEEETGMCIVAYLDANQQRIEARLTVIPITDEMKKMREELNKKPTEPHGL